MKTFIALFALMIVMTNCHKKLDSDIPLCIEKKIRAIESKPKRNPPAQVNEYEYKGKRVFVFSSDCCDNFNEAYDADCNYVCAPSGGITGNGDGKCADFLADAKFVKLVWKDER